eukprot:TRINITY_DN2514_c0_g1_i1.p1 TRINITY_DN2514_c0_g1~~TRINITY_DN2514_c0_g1_i1.p1  ORF type:complete len:85 (-),score=4.80 TRINITY_DN2514_c0_g1_i1:27-281(-)
MERHPCLEKLSIGNLMSWYELNIYLHSAGAHSYLKEFKTQKVLDNDLLCDIARKFPNLEVLEIAKYRRQFGFRGLRRLYRWPLV